MREPVKHHYVPRVYLDSFSNSDGKIWCLDRETHSIFPSVASGIGYIRNFNTATLPDEGKDRTTMEAFYGQFEGKFPDILKCIYTGNLEFEGQRNLLLLVALQFMRSPMTRDILVKVADLIFPCNNLNNRSLGLTDIEIDIIKSFRKGERWAEHELGLRLSGHTFPIITRILESMDFTLFELDSVENIITSDNPTLVTSISKDTRKQWRILPNLPENRKILLYPLTPKMFILGDTKNKEPNALFRFSHQKIKGARTIIDHINSIIELNHLRFIYSTSKETLDEILCHQKIARLDQKHHLKNLAGHCGKLLGALYSQRHMEY